MNNSFYTLNMNMNLQYCNRNMFQNIKNDQNNYSLAVSVRLP